MTQLNPPDFSIGRDAEIAVLATSLSEVASGRGRVVVITGDAGVGKTTLIDTLAKKADQARCTVIRGNCRDTDGAPAFWPWAEAFRSFASTDSQIRTAATGDASPASKLVRSWIDRADTRPGDSSITVFDIQSAVVEHTSEMASDAPLVIILEDVHWADDASLELLKAFAAEIANRKILIAVTCRPAGSGDYPVLEATLNDLKRLSESREVSLQGLSEVDTKQFISRVTGLPASTMLTRALFERTEGNPFFLLECLRSLDPSVWSNPHGLAAQGRFTPVMPSSITGLLSSRVAQLPENTKSVISAASVLGRNFGLELLVPLIEGATALSVLDDFGPAIEAGLIKLLNVSSTEFTFAHALVREAVFDSLPVGTRVRLHAKAAETIESHSSPHDRSRLSELAYHYAMSAAVTGPDPATRFAIEAATRELSVGGYQSAVEILQRALAITDTPETSDDESKFRPVPNPETAQMLALLVNPLWQLLHISGIGVSEIFPPLFRAFNYMAEHGPHEEAVRIAVLPIGFAGHEKQEKQILLRAMELVSPGSSDEAGVLSRYGQLIGLMPDESRDEAAEYIDRAEKIPRACDDRNMLGWIHGRQMYVAINNGELRAAGDAARRALSDADHVTDAECEINLRFYISHSLMQNYDLAEARVQAERCYEAVERGRVPGRAFAGDYARGEAAYLAGDLELARGYEARHFGTARGSAKQAYVEFAIGDHERGWEHLEDARRLYPTEHGLEFNRQTFAAYLVHSMLHYRNTDQMDLVHDAWDGPPKSDNGTLLDLPKSPLWKLGRSIDTTVWHFVLGAGQVSPRLIDFLVTYSGLVESGWVGMSMPVDRAIALAARVNGEFELSAKHSRILLELCARNGYVRDAGWGALEFAELMTQQPKIYVENEFNELLTLALDSATQMGSTLLPIRVDEIRSLATQATGRSRLDRPDGITSRELEVLKLIAAGKTNRQIAEELFISQNTVIRHVSNIFTKTGATSRADATGYAHRRGIVD